MKKLMVFCISVLLFGCHIRNTNNNPEMKGPLTGHQFTDTTTVQVIDSAYDFGNVTDGEKVIYNYRFRNTGHKPLVISSATASCGCTVPEKPDEPIQPGETGFLKVVFNSEGRVGPTHKEINVVSNAYPAFPVLQLTGQVVSKSN
jgi:hypothetical protein